MGKPTGFLESERLSPKRRPVELRLTDWNEVYEPQSEDTTREQAGRCMDCGIPFCHHACPLGNLIPEWNDLVYDDQWRVALERLHATNNFPEFTGRLCPAPVWSACVVSIASSAVTIERVEYEIIEKAFASGWVTPQPPAHETGRSVAIVGSGPAGLAAAQQLRRAGHQVVVFERDDAPGGLLRYGIPEFKMEKAVLDRRLKQLAAEGVSFRSSTHVETTGPSLEELRRDFDAVLLAIGATVPRAITVPGHEADGIKPAMAYLVPSNRDFSDVPGDLNARGRDVIILGGGDTGADCLGTALRQGARTVTQLEIMARPPDARPDSQPWPTMAQLFKVTSAHEEGGERLYEAETKAFLSDQEGRVRALEVRLGSGEIREIPATLVLVAAGFVSSEWQTLGALPVTERGSVAVSKEWLAVEGENELSAVFACGDAVRGQSLIVWALAEGRSAASAIDAALTGARHLPAPVVPGLAPWSA